MFGRNSWWKEVSESCETFEIQCNFCDIVSGLQRALWACARRAAVTSAKQGGEQNSLQEGPKRCWQHPTQQLHAEPHPAERLAPKEVEGNHPSTWPCVTPPPRLGQRRVLCCMPCWCWIMGWNPVSSAAPWVLHARQDTQELHSTRPACKKFSKANTDRSDLFLRLKPSPNKQQ